MAIATYGPDAVGWQARIDLDTSDGCEIVTRFAAEELLVAGGRYVTADGSLKTLRDAQSHRNTTVVDHPGNLGGSDSWEDAGPWQHRRGTRTSCVSAR